MKKEYDQDFFNAWSSGMAYVLGFLFADGNIVRTTRGGYYVAFHSGDRGLLFSIRSAMRSQHKISLRSVRSGKVYRLQIGSKKLFYDLERLALVPGKTKRMKFPKVPAKFLRDFIRGYFDGDGNVWVGTTHRNRRKKTIGIQVSFTSGSRHFLKFLLGRLRNLGIRGGSLFDIKRKKASRLSLSIRDALRLADVMYNAPCELYLPRKKKVFDQFAVLRE